MDINNLSIDDEISQLDLIENWNDKISKVKEIKERINQTNAIISELINSVIKDEFADKKKKPKHDFNTLVEKFHSASTIEEKILLYRQISTCIDTIESQLFSI
jgi:hypothetical protein